METGKDHALCTVLVSLSSRIELHRRNFQLSLFYNILQGHSTKKGAINSPEIPLRLSTKQVLEFGIHGWFSIDILSFDSFEGK